MPLRQPKQSRRKKHRWEGQEVLRSGYGERPYDTASATLMHSVRSWKCDYQYSGPYAGEDFSGQDLNVQTTTGHPQLRTVSQHVSVEMIHWDDYQEASAGCVHGGHLVDSPLNEGMLTAVKRVCPYVVERFPESAGAVRAAGKVEVGDIVSQTTCQMPPLALSDDTTEDRDSKDRWCTYVGVQDASGLPANSTVQSVCADDEGLLVNDRMRLLVPSAAKVELPAPSVLDLVRRPQENALLEEMLSMAQLCHRPTVGTSCIYTRTQPLVTAAWGGGVWRMEKGETGVVTGVNGYGEARLRKEDGSESTWLAHNVAGVDPHSQAGRPRLCLPKAVVLGLLPAAVSIGFALPAVPSSARDELLQSLFRVIGAPGFPGDLRDTDFHAIVSGLSAVQGWSDRRATRLCVHCHCLMRLCVRTVAASGLDMCLHAGLLLGVKRGGPIALNVLGWVVDVLRFRERWGWRPDTLDVSADNVAPLLRAVPPALVPTNFQSRAELFLAGTPRPPSAVSQARRILSDLVGALNAQAPAPPTPNYPLTCLQTVMQELQIEQQVRNHTSELGLAGVLTFLFMMLRCQQTSTKLGTLDVGSLYEHAVLGTEEAAAGIRDTRTEVKALLLCAGRNPEKYGDQRSLWMQVGEFIPGGALPWLWCSSKLLFCVQLLALLGKKHTFSTPRLELPGWSFGMAIRGLVLRAVRQTNSEVMRRAGIACIEQTAEYEYGHHTDGSDGFEVFCGLLCTDLTSSQFAKYLAALSTVCSTWNTDLPRTVCRFVRLGDQDVNPFEVCMQAQFAAAKLHKTDGEDLIAHWAGNGMHSFATAVRNHPLHIDPWDQTDDDKIIKSLVHVRRRIVEVGAESNLLADRVAIGGHNPMRSQLILEVHHFCERALRQGRREVRLQVLEWLVGLNRSAPERRLCEPELRLFLPLVQDSLSEWRVEDGCDLPACTAAFSMLQTSYVSAYNGKPAMPITFFMATEEWAAVAEKALAETESIVRRFAGLLAAAKGVREGLEELTAGLGDGGMLGDTADGQFTQVAARSVNFLLSISCVESQSIPDSGPQRNDPAHLRGLSELEFSRMYGGGGKEQWDKAQLHTHSYPAERCVEAVRRTLHKLMPLLAMLPAFKAGNPSWQLPISCGLLVIIRCCVAFPDLVQQHAVSIVRPLALILRAYETEDQGIPGGPIAQDAAVRSLVPLAIGCVLNVTPEAVALPLDPPVQICEGHAGGDFSVFIQAEHTASMTEVSLPADATVGEFRRRAAALLGLGTGRVQLFYQGELLPSDQTALADSGLSAESVVQVRDETECHLWMPAALSRCAARAEVGLAQLFAFVCLAPTPLRGVADGPYDAALLQTWNAAAGLARALWIVRDKLEKHSEFWTSAHAIASPVLDEKCTAEAKQCADEVSKLWRTQFSEQPDAEPAQGKGFKGFKGFKGSWPQGKAQGKGPRGKGPQGKGSSQGSPPPKVSFQFPQPVGAGLATRGGTGGPVMNSTLGAQSAASDSPPADAAGSTTPAAASAADATPAAADAAAASHTKRSSDPTSPTPAPGLGGAKKAECKQQ